VPAVVIVEDHLLLAETLRSALAMSGIEAEVVAPVPGADLLGEVSARHPVLVLLDLDLGACGASEWLIAPLTAAGVRVLIMTGSEDRLRIAGALERGAIGYQPKAQGFAALADCASDGLAGRPVLDPGRREALLDELNRARARRAGEDEPFDRLTDRERATLRALTEGHSVHMMARQWVVSEATVRSHVRGVLLKLEVGSQLAAVALARRYGWFTDDAD
jgi:DNA-binding NarL/FixJ family response regulator